MNPGGLYHLRKNHWNNIPLEEVAYHSGQK